MAACSHGFAGSSSPRRRGSSDVRSRFRAFVRHRPPYVPMSKPNPRTHYARRRRQLMRLAGDDAILVLLEPNLHLGDDPPPSGQSPTRSPIVGAADARDDPRLRAPVRTARYRLAHDLSVHDLVEALVLRDLEQVGGSGDTTGSTPGRHVTSLSRPRARSHARLRVATRQARLPPRPRPAGRILGLLSPARRLTPQRGRRAARGASAPDPARTSARCR